MLKLLKLASNDFLQSFLPILMWYIIGFLYGDTDLSNIFALTYAYQFLIVIIYKLFINGAVKYQKKNNLSENISYTAIIIAPIVCLFFMLFFIFNVDSIILYFNVDKKYTLFYIFRLLCLCNDLIIMGVTKIMQFNNDDKKAFKTTILYYLSQIFFLIFFKIFVPYNIISIILTITEFFLIAFIVLVKEVNITKLDFRFLKGIKIELSSIIGDIFMFIIYFFILSKVTNVNPLIIGSLNIVSMCTDSQWDILYSSIDTRTSLLICDKKFDKKRKNIFITSFFYSLLLLLSSIIMFSITKLFVDYNVKEVFTVFLIECCVFPLSSFRYVIDTWLKLEYGNNVYLSIINILSYFVRLLGGIFISSIFAINIGFAISVVIHFILEFVLYKNVTKKYLNVSEKCIV